MGHKVNAICQSCGYKFKISHGGGFVFHMLRCDRCGRTKSVLFDEIKEIHESYIGKNISKEEYHNRIENYVGSCNCSGEYKFHSPPRCPKCKSKDIEEGEITILYD